MRASLFSKAGGHGYGEVTDSGNRQTRETVGPGTEKVLCGGLYPLSPGHAREGRVRAAQKGKNMDY